MPEAARSSGQATARSLVDGRYRVESVLGEGAMGAVLRVYDTSQGRELALKRLHGVDDESVTGQLRSEVWFRREFHTLARLRHPSVIEVYDFGLHDGLPYYTMELLEGRDLRDMQNLDIREICSALRDVASALAFLHARRLLHRDLKARNVRCTGDGRAKLIDFGVLATMGVMGDVAGTPPSIPPEALRGLPLDGRADLFGLGALGYWLLTGRHAYPARRLSELEKSWSKRPPAPSRVRGGVPAPVDDLIMSLLAIDRARRPETAAEVIDRLVAIAGLEPEPGQEVAHGWLVSAAIVGRDPELDRVRAMVTAKPGSGQPRAMVFQAPSGMGKTRLLREAGLEGQIAGVTVLSARGGGSGAPYDVVHQLVRAALTTCPGEVVQTIQSHAPVIGHIAPAVLELVGVRRAPSLGDATEDRMRMQVELLRWFRELSRVRPLLLLVDELQRCDEGSAALLAALALELTGRKTRIVLICAHRTDEPTAARAAVAALREMSQVIALEGLDRPGVTQLVTALFGDVPNTDHLATWMHQAAGGSPMHCMELARHLVDQEKVRYAEGTWMIPPELGLDSLPRGFAEAMDGRIAALPRHARDIAEVLAVVGGSVPLDVCVEVSGHSGDDESARADLVFGALDDLVIGDVVLGDRQGFEIRHDGLREALVRGLDDDRRRTLHRRAAHVLDAAQGLDAAREASIGWHYLHGGEALEGARRLVSAGRRLYAAQSFADALQPLEAALEVYEQNDIPRRTTLELRHMLIRAGVICDRRVILRYADETIAAFRADAGLHVAEWARPYVGARIALFFALLVSALDWLRPGARERRMSPIASVTALLLMVGYTASVHSLAFATARLVPLIDLLRPLHVLRNRIPGAAYLMMENFLWIAEGKFDLLHRNSQRILEVIENDDRTPLSEIDRKLALGGIHFMQASSRALDQDPSYQTSCEALDVIDLRFFVMGARMSRVFFHRLRGEEPQAQRLEKETEILFVQLGNAWVFESQHAWISSIAYGMTRDVSGLKRSLEALERRTAEGYRLQGFARLARGEYLRAVGDPAGSRIALARALDEVPRGNLLLEQLTSSALADSLLAERDWPGALEVAQRSLASMPDGEQGLQTARIRLGRARALARAFCGDPKAAQTELDQLLERARPLGSPLLLGMLHEAAAIVSREGGYDSMFKLHVRHAEEYFTSTDNPVLVTRARRLTELKFDVEAPRESAEATDDQHTVQIDRDADSGPSFASSSEGTEFTSAPNTVHDGD
jgi:hypothetical protein